jgi:pimeloyl-ACP methyl ester carboxylesterase
VRATTRPILAAFLTLLSVMTPVASPARAGRDPAPGWVPCAEDPAAQCGSIEVPVDWAKPYGPEIRMAVVRRPAADPAARIGTLFVNPGGPGGSGVDFALAGAGYFSARLRERFDIVGFDPRGVRRSNPVRCGAALLAATPPAAIDTAAQYERTVAHHRRLAADCAARTGALFGHVDTLSVVRDMEALRAALGERRISFYGASYGTLLGEQYAARYPHRIRALVLDSVIDHSIGIGEFLNAGATAMQDLFDEFVAWCDRSTECAVHGRDVRGLWDALRAAARRGTLAAPFAPGQRLTEFELINVAAASFATPQWHALGNFIRAATAGVGARRAGPVADSVEYALPAVFCDDWVVNVAGYADLRGRLRRAAARSRQMPYSPVVMSAVNGCLGWPGPTDNPQRLLPPARTGPILLVNARHDPTTPHAWARRVAAQLGPRASLLTYEGWGHLGYGRTSCVTAAVDRYLLTLRPPAARASCPGVAPQATGIGGVGPGRRAS